MRQINTICYGPWRSPGSLFLDIGGRIDAGVSVGSDICIGACSFIDSGVSVGSGTKIGMFCHIHRDCIIGENVVIGDYVSLQPETTVGDNSQLDDYVNTSGYCRIGCEVKIKRQSMIGQATVIEDGAKIQSGVRTIRLKYPNDPKDKEVWTTIGGGATIGSGATLGPGVKVGQGAIVGFGAVVTKDVPAFAVVVGNPAKELLK